MGSLVPLDPATAATGAGGLLTLGALFKLFAAGREARLLARRALADAVILKQDVRELEDDVEALTAQVASLTGSLKSVEDQGRRNENGITTLQELVRQQTHETAASRERTAALLGEIIGEMRGVRRPHRRFADLTPVPIPIKKEVE